MLHYLVSQKKKNAPPNKCKLINTIINLWTFVIFFYIKWIVFNIWNYVKFYEKLFNTLVLMLHYLVWLMTSNKNLICGTHYLVKMKENCSYLWEIIVYSRSIINTYSLLLHEWWVLLIKFIMRPTIHMRWESMHL